MKYRPLNSREFDYFIHKNYSQSYRTKATTIQFRKIGDIKWRDEVLLVGFGGQVPSIEERKGLLIHDGWKRVTENEALENLNKEFEKYKETQEIKPFKIGVAEIKTTLKQNASAKKPTVYDSEDFFSAYIKGISNPVEDSLKAKQEEID
jgi:hypothetical protein